MLAWIIVLLILLLILTFPIGVDTAYSPQGFFLKLKLGPFRKQILPAKGEKKPKTKKDKPQQETQTEEPKKKSGRLPKLSLDDILELAEIALDALHRLCFHLSIDLFELRWVAAADDPYAAVVQYGRVNALLGALAGPAHRVFHVLREDVRTELDLEETHPVIATHLILSIQIWEILLIGICAGVSGLRWYLRKKREARAAAEGSAGKELT